MSKKTNLSIQRVSISEVKPNPNNPRVIKDNKFDKLVESIISFPQMLEIRPIVVNNDMIVLGGNMRLRACQEAGLKEVPIIKADDLTPEQQREFIIKDNVGFGEWDWDALANEWNPDELTEWGIDTSFLNEDLPMEETKSDSDIKSLIVIAVDKISDIDKITDFYSLEATELTIDMKNMLFKQKKAYVFKS